MSIKVADLGYLGWTYGCTEMFQDQWTPFLFQDHIITVDSGNLYRANIYPKYKTRRQEMRAADEDKIAKHKLVHEFQEKVQRDDEQLLHFFRYTGLEADDLIALLAWRYGPVHLVGVDKDLLQLGPYIARMQRVSGEEVTLSHWSRKLPKALSNIKLTPQMLLYYLALMGDKSDTVGRLIPKYHLEVMAELCDEQYPWSAAVEVFGEDFLYNLYVTALPYPGLFGVTPEELVERLDENEWKPSAEIWGRLMLYHPELYDQLESIQQTT